MAIEKTALITGVTGQDGSYLAEFLLDKGYRVHGLVRRNSDFTSKRIDPILFHERFTTHYGDVVDTSSLHSILAKTRPAEVYHLAAQSHVAVSFGVPDYSAQVNALGTLRLLNAIREVGLDARFYQASSSELYGGLPGTEPQDEHTPFTPRSPYSTGKLFAYWTTVNYREAYGIHASNGILFNHESPRRGETFVTRKITRAVAAIKAGRQDFVYMGNLDAIRDWGYAPEYVEGMWRMLQTDEPDDYVLATGTGITVREFLEISFGHAGLDWEKHVKFDERYLRPAEVDALIGDATKARENLGWQATVDGRALARLMVDADIEALEHAGTPWIDTVRLDFWPTPVTHGAAPL